MSLCFFYSWVTEQKSSKIFFFQVWDNFQYDKQISLHFGENSVSEIHYWMFSLEYTLYSTYIELIIQYKFTPNHGPTRPEPGLRRNRNENYSIIRDPLQILGPVFEISCGGHALTLTRNLLVRSLTTNNNIFYRRCCCSLLVCIPNCCWFYTVFLVV